MFFNEDVLRTVDHPGNHRRIDRTRIKYHHGIPVSRCTRSATQRP